MKLMFICGECGGQSEGILVRKTNYDNTTNMDELDVCCLYCGNLLAKEFTSRSFLEPKQEELWEENKRKDKNRKHHGK